MSKIAMVTRPEKILIAMCKLSKGTTQPCRYEDIVVNAFKLFPEDFQLRGYSQFPDSSDIHKPLYGPLKKQGLVRAANKTFHLTEKGLTRAKELAHAINGSQGMKAERLTRDIEQEISRLKATTATRLFLAGDGDKILDTDFYAYLGATVRTERNDFLGRLRAVGEAVETAAKLDPQPLHMKLKELHDFSLKKFDGIIKRRQGGRHELQD